MTAVGEFTARNTDEPGVAEFAADQLPTELHLTVAPRPPGRWTTPSTVTCLLLATCAALRAGRIHPVHVRIIEDETQVLSAEDVAKADAVLAEAAGSLTFGKLRAAAHRLVLELDPESAPRAAQGDRQAGRTCAAGSARNPETRGWSPTNSRRMRFSPLGSMSSSGPWTCVPPGCPVPCRSSASAATSISFRNATAARRPPARPGWHQPARRLAVDDGNDADGNDGSGLLAGPDSGPVQWPRQRSGRQRPRPPARVGDRAQLRRAGEHHRAMVRDDRPVRHPRRRGRVRAGRRRSRPRPGRRRGPRSPHSLVHHRAASRRNRRRSRLRSLAATSRQASATFTAHPRPRPAPRRPPAGLDRPACVSR